MPVSYKYRSQNILIWPTWDNFSNKNVINLFNKNNNNKKPQTS